MQTKKKIVIVGGGFGGVYAALNLNTKLADVCLISKENFFLFTPLLHEVATGSVNPSNIIQPLRQITTDLGISFHKAEVLKVNNQENYLQTSLGNVPYDYLVLALGAKTDADKIKNNSSVSKTFELKSLTDAKEFKNHIIDSFEKAVLLPANSPERKQFLQFVVIGAGATGVELAAEVGEFIESLLKVFPEINKTEPLVYLLHRGQSILKQFHKNIQEKAFASLSQKPHLKIMLSTEVQNISEGKVSINNNKEILTHTVVLAAGVKAASLEFQTQPNLNNKNQILVNQFLQIENTPNIFVVGDMAAFNCAEHSIPQTAQAAESSAKAAAQNINLLLTNQALKPFKFKEKGQLISLGRWTAAAEIGPFKFFGHFAWWVWRTIYASKIVGWANRIRVVLDWTIDIFYPRDISKF